MRRPSLLLAPVLGLALAAAALAPSAAGQATVRHSIASASGRAFRADPPTCC